MKPPATYEEYLEQARLAQHALPVQGTVPTASPAQAPTALFPDLTGEQIDAYTAYARRDHTVDSDDALIVLRSALWQLVDEWTSCGYEQRACAAQLALKLGTRP